MSGSKSLEKLIDYSVKIIPLLIFLFLLINFIFNLGYFFIIGNKFLSLLTISDYYEGSAPLVSITVLSFGVIFNAVFLNNHVRASFIYFNLIFSSKVSVPIRILKINLETNIHYKFNHSKYTYADKRLLIKKRKELKSIKNDMNENVKDMQEFNPLISWSLSFIIILPIVIIFINSIFISMLLFFILLIIYILILIFASKKKSIAKYYFLTMLSIIFIFCLGIWCFLRDYSIDTVSYIANSNKDIQVIRPISKGILIKSQNGISFIDWNGKVFFSRQNCDLISVLITDSDYERQKNADKSVEETYKRGKSFMNRRIKNVIENR